ncbi:hypothetical protein EEL30_05350 [Brevibacillus laterosporus]|uniref:Uncharacterized protein n=1 Tax=Brevibacillus laterosporus TaxID=1465 RepID=A0A518V4B7_BRELA|nr:hypothetical protein EEL30_05350 [Brevibacillus laterosporus]
MSFKSLQNAKLVVDENTLYGNLTNPFGAYKQPFFSYSFKTLEGVSLCWYGVTPIKKLKLIEPARILRKQELKLEWSERRLELKKEAKDILLETKQKGTR